MRARAHRFAVPVVVIGAAVLMAGSGGAAPIGLPWPEDPVTCGPLDGNSTECTSPGNVEINGTPPAVDTGPENPFWGDYGGDPVVGPPVIGPPHVGGR
jgi:hypothetical protein